MNEPLKIAPAISSYKSLRLLICALLALILMFTAVPARAKKPVTPEKLTILYFNDFHGALESLKPPEKNGPAGGAARLVKLVKDIKKQNDRAGVPTLVVNSGDFVQGQPLSNAHQGAIEAVIFNMMGLDAYSLGNHEMDFGQDRLLALIREIRAPCVTSNLTVRGRSVGAPFIFTKGGIKIGVAGIVAQKDFSADHPVFEPFFLKDIKAGSETAAARSAVVELRSRGADFVILLTHLGDERDKALAKKVSGIDLICGAHSHTEIKGAIKVGKTAVVQAGSWGKHLGRVDVEFSGGRPERVSAQLIPISATLAEDTETAKLVASKKAAMPTGDGDVLAQNKCQLMADADLSRTRETAAGDLVADAMKEELHADAAIINGGAIRASLAKGPVTAEKIKTMLPFTESPTHLVAITGAELARALDHSAKQFGKGGFLQVSGLSFTLVPMVGAYDIRVGDAPLDSRKVYALAVNSFIATGGDGYVMLRDIPAERRAIHPTASLLLARHIKIRYGATGRTLSYCAPGKRIRLPLVSALPVRLDTARQKAYLGAENSVFGFSFVRSRPCSA